LFVLPQPPLESAADSHRHPQARSAGFAEVDPSSLSESALAGFSISAFTIYAGRCLQKRRKKGLIYPMVALNCPFIPSGTALGIFIFIVLSSPAAIEELRPGV